MVLLGVTNSNKELTATRIDCGGSFRVKLSLTAEPDIVSNPTDIVLILDRSGSMAGSPLENLKIGAKTFIDIIDEAGEPIKVQVASRKSNSGRDYLVLTLIG